MTQDDDVARLTARFRRQVESAVQRSSPLYETLLRRCVEDLEQRGPTWDLLQAHAREPAGSAVALRLLAAVHRLVLDGTAPGLAAAYPSTGGDGDPARAWEAFRAVLVDHRAEVAAGLRRPLQTNEVGRCAAVVLGLARVAELTGTAPCTLEIGASAGLNLNWHRYRYTAGDATWGPESSPVRLGLPAAAAPALAALRPPVEVLGCDRAPLDATSAEDRLWLRACVWADQVDRLAALDAAFAVAAEHPPAVERAPAAAWLEVRLAQRRQEPTVVVQTVVDQYLDDDEREALTDVLDEAGRLAAADAPVAWVRMESPRTAEDVVPGREGLAEVRVRVLPDGPDEVVAYAGFHGRPVHLAGGSSTMSP
jgi:hypothetical protein